MRVPAKAHAQPSCKPQCSSRRGGFRQSFLLGVGRVKRCSSKQVDVVAVGRLRLDPGWHNRGYIFPEGFRSSVRRRLTVMLAMPIQAVAAPYSSTALI